MECCAILRPDPSYGIVGRLWPSRYQWGSRRKRPASRPYWAWCLLTDVALSFVWHLPFLTLPSIPRRRNSPIRHSWSRGTSASFQKRCRNDRGSDRDERSGEKGACDREGDRSHERVNRRFDRGYIAARERFHR